MASKPLYFALHDCTFYEDGLASAHAVLCAEGTPEGMEALHREWVKNWEYGSFIIFQVDSLDPRTCKQVYLREGSAAIPYPHPGCPDDYGLESPRWFSLAMAGSNGNMKTLGEKFRAEDAEEAA